MLQTHTPGDRVTAAQDVLAAVTLSMFAAQQERRERRAARSAVRAQRRADRAVRLVLRGRVGATETPGS
jgi:hypothetical protein